MRYHFMFVIDMASRRVRISGIASDPNGDWMKQVARNLTDMWDGFFLGIRYLIYVVIIVPKLSSVVVVGPLCGYDITVNAGVNFWM